MCVFEVFLISGAFEAVFGSTWLYLELYLAVLGNMLQYLAVSGSILQYVFSCVEILLYCILPDFEFVLSSAEVFPSTVS